MSQRYPCPNPTCVHEFTAEDLSGVASVTCPQCGMIIQLRAAPAPVQPAAVPLARPVGPVPLARAVTPAVPVVPPVPPPPVTEAAEPGAPILRAPRPVKSRDLLTYTLVIGGFLLLLTFGIVGALVGFRGGVGNLLKGSGFRNSDYNIKFDPKVPGWEDGAAMKNRMKVILVLQRSNPLGYFALDVIDYKDHTPTPRELNDEARRKLKALFTRNLETEPGRDAPPAEASPVAGQKAHRIVFNGDTSEQTLAGEVTFFGYQGLGYWLYAFAVDPKALEEEFKELRRSIELLGDRPEWTTAQHQRKVFTGDKVKGYELADSTGRWKLYDDPTGHDPAADIVLRALDPARPRDPTLGADLIVMSLKPDKDAIEAVKAHVLAKQAREGSPRARISDSYPEGEGPKDHVGEAKGHLLQWRINKGEGRELFAIVGIVPRAGDLLVFYGECPWERRANWEVQLQQLIESLQLKE